MLTRMDRATIVVLTAVCIALLSTYRAQDPPRRIEPAPLQPTEPKPPKPITAVFGNTYEEARILRPKTIGVIGGWTNPEDGRTYTMRYLGAGIRPQPEGTLIPTDQEFLDWLALPEGHEYEYDLQGYLESIRG